MGGLKDFDSVQKIEQDFFLQQPVSHLLHQEIIRVILLGKYAIHKVNQLDTFSSGECPSPHSSLLSVLS